MIVDLKFTYPSGLASAIFINGFDSQGDQMAMYTYTIATLIDFLRLEKHIIKSNSNLERRTSKIQLHTHT